MNAKSSAANMKTYYILLLKNFHPTDSTHVLPWQVYLSVPGALNQREHERQQNLMLK